MKTVVIPANSAQNAEFEVLEVNGDGVYLIDAVVSGGISYIKFTNRNGFSGGGFGIENGNSVESVKTVSLQHGSELKLLNVYNGDNPELTIQVRVVRLGND
jgi:hypothetical protein